MNFSLPPSSPTWLASSWPVHVVARSWPATSTGTSRWSATTIRTTQQASSTREYATSSSRTSETYGNCALKVVCVQIQQFTHIYTSSHAHSTNCIHFIIACIHNNLRTHIQLLSCTLYKLYVFTPSLYILYTLFNTLRAQSQSGVNDTAC